MSTGRSTGEESTGRTGRGAVAERTVQAQQRSKHWPGILASATRQCAPRATLALAELLYIGGAPGQCAPANMPDPTSRPVGRVGWRAWDARRHPKAAVATDLKMKFRAPTRGAMAENKKRMEGKMPEHDEKVRRIRIAAGNWLLALKSCDAGTAAGGRAELEKLAAELLTWKIHNSA